MPESNQNLISDEQDRTEWDRDWATMESRKVERVTELDVQALLEYDFGPTLSVVVSKIPIQYIDQMYFSTQDCPLCNVLADDPETAYAAGLSIEFEGIKGIMVSVWVHRECFNNLPISDEPAPVPW